MLTDTCKRQTGDRETLSSLIEHAWELSETDAIALQHQLAPEVVRADRFGDIRRVAGVDVAYDEQHGRQFAAAVVLDASSLDVVDHATARAPVQFPYIPGLFSFRELPAIGRAVQGLKSKPDLIVCDGHGVAHPRRFGLASHIGVWLNIPAIGCSKTRLLGDAEAPGLKRGEHAVLVDKGEVIGRVLRTQDNVKPLYVSIGHLISLPTACSWVLKLSPHYRLPETTRHADRMVRRLRARTKIY